MSEKVKKQRKVIRKKNNKDTTITRKKRKGLFMELGYFSLIIVFILLKRVLILFYCSYLLHIIKIQVTSV